MNECTEAASQYQPRAKSTEMGNGNKNAMLAQKLKGHNFTLKEQTQGGQINNYFQTSNS